MKLNEVISVVVLLMFWTLNKTSAEIGGCTVITTKKVSCRNYTLSLLPYDQSYKNVEEFSVEGSFTELNISSQYVKLRMIKLRSHALPVLNLNLYSNFDLLLTLDARESGIELVNFTDAHTLTRLRVIHLAFNKISKIYGCQSLKMLPNLKAITLKNNNLEEVDFNCFPKKLTGLYLQSNKIKNVSSCLPLRELTSLTKFALAENQIKEFDFSCLPFSLMVLYLDGNEISQLANCLYFKRLPNLGRLSLADNNLDSFDFDCVPPTVYDLFLFGNKISQIGTCKSLQALTGLSGLFLNSNRLPTFNFSCLPQSVITLSLANNSITHISSCEKLRDLPKLQYLFFSGNSFTSFNISCLPSSLVDLDLANNTISQLFSFESLKDLSDLTRVSLAENAIKNVDFRYFSHSIRYLYLNNNSFSRLELDLLSNFPQIEVAVHDNPIVCSCKLLVHFVKLVKSGNVTFKCENENNCVSCNNFLDSYPWSNDINNMRSYDDQASGCFASYLKEASKARTDVKITNASCTLEQVDGYIPTVVCNDYHQEVFPFHDGFEYAESLDIRGMFTNFSEVDERYTQLRHIKLASTLLTTIHLNPLSQFKWLKILDVSGSSIERIMLTEKLEHLDEIDVHDNKLSTIKKQNLKLCTNLKRLYLGDNKLEILEMKHLPLQLVELDVQNNNISNVLFDPTDEMTNLRLVDFSHNQLEAFTLSRLPSTLQLLRLNGNRISKIDTSSCNKFHANNLTLNIQDNPLHCTCQVLSDYRADFNTCNIKLKCGNDSRCFTCNYHQSYTSLASTAKFGCEDQSSDANRISIINVRLHLRYIFIVGFFIYFLFK